MTSKVPLYSSNGPSPLLPLSSLPTNHFTQTNHPSTLPPDLKTTTDDAIPAYLTTLPDPFIQNHTKTNVRFLLGYTAVAIAGFTFYADRKLGWEATTSPWIIAAVGVYFVLNSALTYWIWGVERGEVFSGVRKGSGELVCFPAFVFEMMGKGERGREGWLANMGACVGVDIDSVVDEETFPRLYGSGEVYGCEREGGGKGCRGGVYAVVLEGWGLSGAGF